MSAISPSNLDLKIEVTPIQEWNGLHSGDDGTHTIIIGRLESLKSNVTSSNPTLEYLLNQNKPPTDLAKTDTTILSEEGSHYKVTLITLPSNASRHNCSIRPDEISSQVSKQVSSSSTFTQIIVFTKNKKEALASVVACSRSFPVYSRKTSNDNNPTENIEDVWRDKVQIRIIVDKSEDLPSTLEKTFGVMSGGVRRSAFLVDAPTNELNTTVFVQEAQAVVQRLNREVIDKLNQEDVTIQVIPFEELKARGFGGLVGVGRAAAHPPALVLLSYRPPSPSQTVVLVGKGIVYDTGGLSIKGKTTMPGMKRDMGGAASVLSAFETAVRTETFPHTLHAILCLAENSVSMEATRPDDILTLYSGKTVEVNNTDAEGRLVLGDGVAYASRHLKPDIICDMATLTGAQGVATGQYFASIYCNDHELEHHCVFAGHTCGELVHPVPYCPEIFRQEFKSVVADMKNSVKNRGNAQVSCAGQFIGDHLGEGYEGKWLHVDMAATAHLNERGTGFGVALLVTLFHSQLL